MSVFEVIMLLCFGAAWPASIYRSWVARSAKGKSIMFLVIILIGYVAGICNKLFYSYDSVIYLYMLNFVMVLADAVLYFRNKRFDRQEEQRLK